MKFIESYNKIVNAYLKDELEPLNACACFVGNLLNNSLHWGTTCSSENYQYLGTFNDVKPQRRSYHIDVIRKESNNFYTSDDITRLEYNFLHAYGKASGFSWIKRYKDTRYEEELYRAMESTLLLLKQIHEEKGEIVEDYTFTKRELLCGNS